MTEIIFPNHPGMNDVSHPLAGGFLRSSRKRIFSRIASMMNSERLRYAYSGCLRIISSILSSSWSGIFTVVYEVAMCGNHVTTELIIGSNVDVIHSNFFIGGIY